MASPPSTSTSSSSTSGLPKRKRIKPRRLSGSEAVPLASGLAQAVEVARSQQLAKEQAEAAAAAMVAASVAAAEASIKKDMDGSESSAVARAMDARDEERSPITKLDGGLREGSGDVSPRDAKPHTDIVSEADSNDGRSSALAIAAAQLMIRPVPKKRLYMDRNSST